MSNTAVSSSAKGASFLILLQIGSRALTFVINQVLLRYLSPQLLGVSVQLELYSISVLYFARESIRVALQRQSGNIQTVVNISYLGIFAGVVLSYLCALLYLQADVPNVPYLIESLKIYGIASVVELLAEPAFVAAQHKLLYKTRASAEGAATIARCIVTCGVTIWASKASKDLGVLPFAFGQMSYAILLLGVYVVRCLPVATSDRFSLLLTKIGQRDTNQYVLSFFSLPLLKLSLSLWLQSAFKYLLTQGDSWIVTIFTSLEAQGAYALASNYGGLIARMVFQPIEETSRNLFGKLCAPEESSGKPSRTNIGQAKGILRDILKFYSLVSLLAAALGPTVAPLLLEIVAGSRWVKTGAGEVLASYCYYIPLLAINGVTEAFVAAVASNTELGKQSVYMIGFFVSFASAAWLFLGKMQLGAQGLVYANCVNMSLRIVWGFMFIRSYFAKQGSKFNLMSILPSAYSVMAAAATPGLLHATRGTLRSYGVIGELARTGAVAIQLLLAIAIAEREYIKHCYELLRLRTQGDDKKVQ